MSKSRRVSNLREDFLSGIGVPEQRPFVPDTFQLEAIESLVAGNDTLVIAPTGAGKTYIAVEAIRRTAQQGQRSVYTAPLKALSNSKYADFKRRYHDELSVGLLTGDRKIDGGADVVIATTEIYRNELYSMSGNYSLVVLDEFHYLADPQRGPVWEESIILSPRSATLLLLSASISNSGEIKEWMENIRQKPVKIITVEERPVELRLGFMHPDFGVLPLADDKGQVLDEVQQFYSTDAKFPYKGGGRRGRGGGGDKAPGGRSSRGRRGGRRR